MTDVDLESEDWREKEKSKARQEQWDSLCEVVLLVSPSQREALEIVRREASDRGCSISPQTAEILLVLMDRDLGRIVQELEKLCLFCGASAEITADAVELLAGSRGALKAQSLQQAIGTGDPSIVIQVVEDRIPRGSYLPLVLADLARHIRQLLLLQSRRVRDGREASKVLWSARLPAPQPLIPELLRQSRQLSPRHLVQCLQDILQAEVDLRSSPADERLVLERLSLGIARPLRPGSPLPDEAGNSSPLRPSC
jgi:DNA polymerase-3 subunit delta